jgi:hypothetical protein
MSRVRVPRHLAWLVVDYFAYAARPGATARRATSHAAPRRLLMLCDRVPRHVVWLVVDHAPSHRSTSRRSVALALAVHSVTASRGATTRRPGLHRLYCTYVVHPNEPSRRSTSRQSVTPALAVCLVNPLCVVTTRLAVATDIVRLRCASGCLSTSRGSSSTTSTTPRVRVPRHVARLVTRLVVDYIDSATRPGASARRAARRRLLRLCCAIECIGTSRGSSSTTRRLAARLLVGRSHWLSPCIRSLHLVARLLVVPDCTGSNAPMPCIRTRRVDARHLVSSSHRLSPCARVDG